MINGKIITCNKKEFFVFAFDHWKYTSIGTVKQLEKTITKQSGLTGVALKWIGLYPDDFISKYNPNVERVTGEAWAAAGGWGYYWDNPYGEFECSSGKEVIKQLLKANGIWTREPDEFDQQWEREEEMKITDRQIIRGPIAFLEVCKHPNHVHIGGQ